MKFDTCALPGAFIIRLEPHQDERGFLARSFCRHEFEQHGLVSDVAQCNISYNARRGTLRGIHFQRAPHEETKLVRCIRGAIYDIIVDIRPASRTFRKWVSIELSAENRVALYVPAGFGHGFQTLEDDTEVFYQMSTFYEPTAAAGVRWNDPAFGVEWPIGEPFISDRDRGYPDWQA
jgi:dTDP-4-dehydrorhamnose 3,5-epimerase